MICEKDERSAIADIDKKKFLVPMDLTIGHFMYVIKKRIHLDETSALYLSVNNTTPEPSEKMSAVYDRHRNSDGFLYVVYSGERSFGHK